MSESKELSHADFNTVVTDKLLAALNNERADIAKLEQKYIFLRQHEFNVEAQFVSERIDGAMDVWIGVCNSLGKFF